MGESEFIQLVEDTLTAIEEAIDDSGTDIEYDTVGDILTLEFSNHSQIIINKQTPLRQLWVAAKSGGYHFEYDANAGHWCLDRDSERDLFSELSEYCSQQAGERVRLSRH